MVLYFLSEFPHLARITLHSPLLYFTLLCIVQLHIIVKSPLLAALENFKESEHKGIRSALAGVLWQLEGKEQHLKEAQKKLERQASAGGC